LPNAVNGLEPAFEVLNFALRAFRPNWSATTLVTASIWARVYDMELQHIVDIMLGVRASA
jgi:hypothetical protein